MILHISDAPEDATRAVSAAEALTASDSQLRVRIIANGAALAGLTCEAEAVTPGERTTVEACALGLQRREIPVGALQERVSTVDNAMVAIVAAQRDGAAYVRI